MNKVAIITGTRKGIGKKLAGHYLEKGLKVCGCSRNEGTIHHENYTHYVLDVADEKAVVKMVRSVRKAHGGLDVLINNAGIAAMNHLLLTPKISGDKIFSTNYFGTFLFMREAAKVMSRAKYGRIINFTTVAVPLALEGEAMYAASKAAVETLTKTAAGELGASGITVNAIGPTPVETDLIKNVPEEKIAALIEHQAVKRMGCFEDIANVIDFFIHENSGFVTGQVLYLGGIHK